MDKMVSNLSDRLRHALNMRKKRAADLANDLKIPKSAISQYLSGKSQKMDSKRLFDICQYLDVSETWLLGYDVSMEKEKPISEDGLTENKIALMNFVLSIPEDKAAKVLKVMRTILEDD